MHVRAFVCVSFHLFGGGRGGCVACGLFFLCWGYCRAGGGGGGGEGGEPKKQVLAELKINTIGPLNRRDGHGRKFGQTCVCFSCVGERMCVV